MFDTQKGSTRRRNRKISKISINGGVSLGKASLNGVAESDTDMAVGQVVD